MSFNFLAEESVWKQTATWCLSVPEKPRLRCDGQFVASSQLILTQLEQLENIELVAANISALASFVDGVRRFAFHQTRLSEQLFDVLFLKFCQWSFSGDADECVTALPTTTGSTSLLVSILEITYRFVRLVELQFDAPCLASHATVEGLLEMCWEWLERPKRKVSVNDDDNNNNSDVHQVLHFTLSVVMRLMKRIRGPNAHFSLSPRETTLIASLSAHPEASLEHILELTAWDTEINKSMVNSPEIVHLILRKIASSKDSHFTFKTIRFMCLTNGKTVFSSQESTDAFALALDELNLDTRLKSRQPLPEKDRGDFLAMSRRTNSGIYDEIFTTLLSIFHNNIKGRMKFALAYSFWEAFQETRQELCFGTSIYHKYQRLYEHLNAFHEM